MTQTNKKAKASKKPAALDIQYGNVNIAEEDFLPKNIKIRVTTFVDLDVVEALKAEAHKKKMKYQTLLNEILRERMFSEETQSAIIVDREAIQKIMERLEKLERRTSADKRRSA